MKNFILKFVLAIMMIAASAVFGVKISQINTSPNPPLPESSSEQRGARFVLKYSDGSVSLFEGENVVETFSEVNFSTLPPNDRESLSQGIEFDNLDEVYMLIEDFDG